MTYFMMRFIRKNTALAWHGHYSIDIHPTLTTLPATYLLISTAAPARVPRAAIAKHP
jgi:hypothetical protein